MLRRALPSLLLAGLTTLLCAGVLEVFLRVRMGPPVHFRFPQARYLPDPEIGHWLAPGQDAFNHDQPLRVNDVGIRGEARSPSPAPGRRRILAIGDSQTFGNGLALGDTWPAQLEQAMNAAPHAVPVEVLNGGLPGTDTWQHERILARLERHYGFDAVVLGFYVNDVVPRYEPEPAAQRTNTWQKRVGYLLKRSALVSLLLQTIQRGGGAAVAERERAIVTGASDARVEAGWTEVERSLRAMRDRLHARGVALTLLVIPRRDQVSGQLDARAYNDAVTTLASRLGIGVIDALAPLTAAYREHGDALFIPWDGHYTGLANGVIAAALAAELPRPEAAPPSLEGAGP